MGSDAKLSPLGAVLAALVKPAIRFQVIGMKAAILQGAPGVTLDTDLWIDPPGCRYMHTRAINIAHRFGDTALAIFRGAMKKAPRNPKKTMADKNNKVPENVPGPWYVDNELCTPCRVCVDEAPELLKYNADESKVFFAKQPEGDAELAHAQSARDVCPQAAIAEDGE